MNVSALWAHEEIAHVGSWTAFWTDYLQRREFNLPRLLPDILMWQSCWNKSFRSSRRELSCIFTSCKPREHNKVKFGHSRRGQKTLVHAYHTLCLMRKDGNSLEIFQEADSPAQESRKPYQKSQSNRLLCKPLNRSYLWKDWWPRRWQQC